MSGFLFYFVIEKKNNLKQMRIYTKFKCLAMECNSKMCLSSTPTSTSAKKFVFFVRRGIHRAAKTPVMLKCTRAVFPTQETVYGPKKRSQKT